MHQLALLMQMLDKLASATLIQVPTCPADSKEPQQPSNSQPPATYPPPSSLPATHPGNHTTWYATRESSRRETLAAGAKGDTPPMSLVNSREGCLQQRTRTHTFWGVIPSPQLNRNACLMPHSTQHSAPPLSHTHDCWAGGGAAAEQQAAATARHHVTAPCTTAPLTSGNAMQLTLLPQPHTER